MTVVRVIGTAAWLVLAGYLLTGCGATGAAGTADDARLWQGTWAMLSATSNGQSEKANMQWVVDGDHYNIRLDGLLHRDPYNITLDPSHKRVDVFHHETPKGTYGGSLKGIYEISGDSLRVCYDLTGQDYPKTFSAGPGSRRAIFEFRRDR